MPRPARAADRRADVRAAAGRGAVAAFRALARDRPAQRPRSPQHGHERRFRNRDPLWRDPCSGRHRELWRARHGGRIGGSNRCAYFRPSLRKTCARSPRQPGKSRPWAMTASWRWRTSTTRFLALGIAGTATRRIELHTGVAIAFARTPMAVANVGWDLAGATDGRFVVGLGSQVRAHNERRFSVPWTQPAPRMREYVQVLRAIWNHWKTGDKPAYEGEHYRFTLTTPNFTPEPIEAAAPAVMIAAVGPAMLK